MPQQPARIRVVSPDGVSGTIDASELPVALQNGYVVRPGASSGPMPNAGLRVPRPEFPPALRGGLTAVEEGQNFGDQIIKRSLEIPKAVQDMVLPLATMGLKGDISNLNPLNMLKSAKEDPAGLGMSMVGLDPETQRTGSKGQVAGDAAFGALTAVLGLTGASKSRQSFKTAPKITTAAAVDKLTDAVIPGINDVPAFKQNLSRQLDRIVNHARENNIPVESVGDVAKVTRDAAQNHPYRRTYLEPYANEIVSSIPDNFKGKPASGAGYPTIGDLDRRLSTINDTLFPRFQKGGAGSQSAQAAIGAENAAALNAEAVAIRNTIAKELSQRTGVPEPVLRGMRGDYGQLQSLADEFQYAQDAAMAEKAKRANTPATLADLNPFNRQGVAGRIPINPQNFFSDIPDRLVRDVFRKLNVGPNPTPSSVATAKGKIAGALSGTSLEGSIRPR